MEEKSKLVYDPVDKNTSLQYLIYNAPYGSLEKMIEGINTYPLNKSF